MKGPCGTYINAVTAFLQFYMHQVKQLRYRRNTNMVMNIPLILNRWKNSTGINGHPVKRQPRLLLLAVFFTV
jgi:hypothetical protein